ncbi:MAG: c-type cytochrome [Chloroflexi bacterium]|nr:c-type cytochrome [Chloroflexota bacterium]
MRKLAILLTLLIAGLFLISCAGAQPTPTQPAPTPETSAIDAAKLFATNCAVCHGEKRQGVSGLGPALTPTSLRVIRQWPDLRDASVPRKLTLLFNSSSAPHRETAKEPEFVLNSGKSSY